MQQAIHRFWAKVDHGRLDRCWEWNACRNHRGYGLFSFEKRLQPSSRVAWKIAWGSIPEGMSVLHRCDNPPCVNPSHLFLGTPSDNTKDMFSKGRGVNNRGERHPLSKLTESMVRDIRERLRRGESPAAVQRIYPIADSHISRIKTRQAWKHIE